MSKAKSKYDAKPKPINVKLAKPMELKNLVPKNLSGVKYLYAEPKLDGFRGIAIVVNKKPRLYTSGGVRVVNGPTIVKALQSLKLEDAVYDGEFFIKDWNDTGSIVKTLTPDHPKRKKLRLRVFDVLTMKEWKERKGTVTLEARKKKLITIKKTLALAEIKGIEVMHYTKIDPSLQAMQEFFIAQVDLGHEGAVFKDPRSVYSFKKSKDWLKLKPFIESDLQIVGVKEGTGKHKGKLGAFKCEGKIDGKKIVTQCGGGLTDELRVKFWAMHKKKNLIGKIIEVRHEGLTKKNAVRFPRFFRERWDKTKPN